MNNFDLHEQAQQLADTRSAYSLARELLEAKVALEAAKGYVESVIDTSGVCCCGDAMERHSSPFVCGHTPLDTGHRHQMDVLDAINGVLDV